MWAKGTAFLIWAAAAVAAVFWGLRVWGESPRPPAHAQPAPAAAVVSGDLTRVLGANPVAPVVAVDAVPPSPDQTRFQLLGVIAAAPAAGAGRSAGPAWATISVDGKPPRTYRLGSVVEGSNVLQKVAARGVEIGPRGGAPAVTLQLTPPPAAATGRPGAAASPIPVMPAKLALPGGLQAPSATPPAPAVTAGATMAPGGGAMPTDTGGGEPDANPVSTAVRRPGLATR